MVQIMEKYSRKEMIQNIIVFNLIWIMFGGIPLLQISMYHIAYPLIMIILISITFVLLVGIAILQSVQAIRRYKKSHH